MLDLSYRFAAAAAPVMCKLRDHNRIHNWIASLCLKRCPWKVDPETGELFHVPWKMQVRVFISAYSPQLSNALLSENLDNELILQHLDNYKWSESYQRNAARNKEMLNEKRRVRSVRYVSTRAGDKRYDWGTVK
jgi:hypothetical protein